MEPCCDTKSTKKVVPSVERPNRQSFKNIMSGKLWAYAVGETNDISSSTTKVISKTTTETNFAFINLSCVKLSKLCGQRHRPIVDILFVL